jgi:hypothetical protein
MIKTRYRIDTYFNGMVKVFFITQKRIGNWPFRYWLDVHEETIYEGNTTKEAQEAINKHVAFIRDSEVKSRSWRNDRGEIPYEELGYF